MPQSQYLPQTPHCARLLNEASSLILNLASDVTQNRTASLTQVSELTDAYICRIYPFLNYTKPWAPIAYIGVFLVHWAFFGVVLLLKRLKERYMPHAAPNYDESTAKLL